MVILKAKVLVKQYLLGVNLMKSIKNQYGKITHDESNDRCENCGALRWRHSQWQAADCKRALANSV